MTAARSILVVDDDAGIRALLVTLLRRTGYRLLEAQNGREALAAMRGGGVDAVIMDLTMPEVSGWEVLRERAADPSLQPIPTILLTACNLREVAADAAGLDVCAVIGKPFDLAVLLSAVKDCLAAPDAPCLAA